MKRIFIIILCLAGLTTVSAHRNLTVGSYNVRHDVPGDYTKHNGWNERKDFVIGTILTAAYDIVGIQEPFHNQVEDLKQGLKDYACLGVGRDDGKEEGEYAPIFYLRERLQLLDSGTFWFSATPDVPSVGWDAKYKRICTWGYFRDRESKKKFYYFNLHLDHKGIQARVESGKMLVERINSICGRKSNFVITGDFNVGQDSDVYRVFMECGFVHDCFETAKFRYAPVGTFDYFKSSSYTTRRIDHIFVSESAEVLRYSVLTNIYWFDTKAQEKTEEQKKEIVDKEKREVHFPSDHYPVQAVLKFGK